jgi:hypothetical protein
MQVMRCSGGDSKRRKLLAIAQGLGNMQARDLLAPVEISQRSCDAQHAVIPFGTLLHVRAQHGQWSLIDLKGDSKLDGYCFSSFLSRV